LENSAIEKHFAQKTINFSQKTLFFSYWKIIKKKSSLEKHIHLIAKTKSHTVHSIVEKKTQKSLFCTLEAR
jgi:hypothetical protein